MIYCKYFSVYYQGLWWVTGPPRKSWLRLRHPWHPGPHPSCPNVRSVRQPTVRDCTDKEKMCNLRKQIGRQCCPYPVDFLLMSTQIVKSPVNLIIFLTIKKFVSAGKVRFFFFFKKNKRRKRWEHTVQCICTYRNFQDSCQWDVDEPLFKVAKHFLTWSSPVRAMTQSLHIPVKTNVFFSTVFAFLCNWNGNICQRVGYSPIWFQTEMSKL